MIGWRARAIALLLAAGALGTAACATGASGGGGGAPPSNVGGGGAASRFQEPCAGFCQHLRALGCKEGQPLASGTSCETFCVDTQEAGHDLKIACVMKIQSCGEIQSCNR